VFGWLGLVAMASIIINGSYAAASYIKSKVAKIWKSYVSKNIPVHIIREIF
jgi:hypothetical protein